MIVDFHTHVGIEPSFLGKIRTPPETLIRAMNAHGIDKAVIFPMPSPKMSQLEVCVLANDYIAQSVRKYSDRLIGFAMITPYTDDTGGSGELKRAIVELGLKGLKLHPDHCGFPPSMDLMRPMLETASDLKIPITIHSGGLRSTAAAIAHLALEYPKVNFIIAHMGGGIELAGESINMVKSVENIYVDTAEGPAPFAIRAAVKAAPSKVLFGSDFFTDWDPYPFELTRVKSMNLSQEEEERILGKNAAQLLDLPV